MPGRDTGSAADKSASERSTTTTVPIRMSAWRRSYHPFGALRPVRLLRLVATAAVVVLLAVVALQARDMLPRWFSPFDEQTQDRSGPAVLRSMRDLSRYEAANGSYQVIVDLERDARFLPDGIRGERTLFVGEGSVDAYVDFGRLDSGAITVSPDRTSVSVRLPHAQLEPTSMNTKRSYVFAQQRGLLDRVGDFFGDNPDDQHRLYVLAAEKIQAAAAASGLRQRADHNAKQMMESMLKALGFERVTVSYAGV
jgi:hypothetical protein